MIKSGSKGLKGISVIMTLSVWHGNEYDNIDMFDLGRIDCYTASAVIAAAAEKVRELLLPIHTCIHDTLL